MNNRNVIPYQKITADDIYDLKLVYTPAADDHGVNYATIKFTVTNDEDVESEDAYTLTFNVRPVADRPHGKDNTLEIDENEQIRIEEEDWGFSNPADKTTLKSVRITAMPRNGTLKDARGDNIEKDWVYKPDELVYTPKRDKHGDDFDALKFKVIDSDNNESADNYRLSFNVIEGQPTHYM